MRGWLAAAVLGAVLWGCGSGSGTDQGAAENAGDHSGRVRAPEGLVADKPPEASAPAATPAAPAGDLGGEVDTATLHAALAGGRDLAFLDVRTPGEFEAGHIEGALNVPIYELDDKLDAVRAFQGGRELVVYCEVGGRTRRAAQVLNEAGFEHVVQYIPGMREWRELPDGGTAGSTP